MDDRTGKTSNDKKKSLFIYSCKINVESDDRPHSEGTRYIKKAFYFNLHLNTYTVSRGKKMKKKSLIKNSLKDFDDSTSFFFGTNHVLM